MKIVKTNIIATLTFLSLCFSTVAIAQTPKMFYQNESGVWTIFGHPGKKTGLPPACVLNQSTDTIGFQYIWGFLAKNNTVSMFSFQDKNMRLRGVGSWYQGAIIFTNEKNGTETTLPARYFVVDPTSFNFEVKEDQTQDVLGAVLASSKIVFHYDTGAKFTVSLNPRDFPTAIGMLAQCIKTYIQKDSI